ncbi:MAG: NUDIX hydrolase [Methylococcaceae bacterium]|nr:NUDIX hydrolase [Methylococcaceae bacterium]MCI0668016.1 NUDIX hydrolase [Methylococcaceae bacterium]MCI0732829.1 NUDIX hydrolase [Methylococcaceae bacterium]
MAWKPHVTVAAIVERDNRFLLVEERISGSLLINQPAGHLEEGESLIDAVKRETNEETGWTFEPTSLIGIHLWQHPENSTTFLRVSFCGHCSDFNPAQELDLGIIRTLWLSREELAHRKHAHRSPLVLRCIDDYLSGARYPLSVLKSMLPDRGGES